jgi:hypothetical protein
METSVFAEKLNNFQHSARLVSESEVVQIRGTVIWQAKKKKRTLSLTP